MNAPELLVPPQEDLCTKGLLNYYEAIEHASQEMVDAAKAGDWDKVMRLEGACAVLIAQLKHAAIEHPMQPDEMVLKTRIMQRILHNDAQIRNLADPWIDEMSRLAERSSDDQLH